MVLDTLAVIKTLGESETVLDSYAPTNSFFSLGSYSTMYPATALAATVRGEARYICPGPHALAVDLLHDPEHLFDKERCEPETRLVEHQDPRPGHQTAADGHHLLLAT